VSSGAGDNDSTGVSEDVGSGVGDGEGVGVIEDVRSGVWVSVGVGSVDVGSGVGDDVVAVVSGVAMMVIYSDLVRLLATVKF
jgi:hypothetical protein